MNDFSQVLCKIAGTRANIDIVTSSAMPSNSLSYANSLHQDVPCKSLKKNRIELNPTHTENIIEKRAKRIPELTKGCQNDVLLHEQTLNDPEEKRVYSSRKAVKYKR